MNLLSAKLPPLVKSIFPKYVWEMETTEKVLYLTFDDGPTPDVTPWVLETLKQYDAKATFFCIGHNIEKHPNIFNQIVNEGHQIGNHTFNHLKGWKTDLDTYISNAVKTEREIEKHTNLSSNLFRPPYGRIKKKQGMQLIDMGYHIIMWSVISIDWDKTVSGETCLKNVTNNAKEGSIVVFHDSIKASENMKYALPRTLEYYRNLGFSFKAISF